MKTFKSFFRISIAMLLIGVSFSAFAQEIGYKITMPKVSKIITVTGNNINFRKAPRANAPTMIFVCVNETDNCGATWNDVRIPRGQTASPLRASQGQTFLVVEETPEWYGVISNGYKAYLSKKFTKEVKTSPITPELLTQKGYYCHENEQYPGITKGKYRGFAILDQNGWDTEGFLVGHIVDGLLVFSHEYSAYINYDENASRLKFEQNEYGTWNITFGKDVAGNEASEWNGTLLDYNKLTEQEFEQLLKISKATTTPNNHVVILANINGQFNIVADYLFVKDIPEQVKTTVSF